ncbi:MAG: peptidylprolyl isomerase [Pirellulaceae bacterium]|nr:peptidylprolyl isomerase [Pirellulaceae bacterium]
MRQLVNKTSLAILALVICSLGTGNRELKAQTLEEHQERVDQFLTHKEKVENLARQLATADEAQKATFLQELQKSTQEGVALAARARTSAISIVQQTDNPEQKVVNFLSEIASAEIKADLYEKSLEISQLLISKGNDSPEMHAIAGVSAFGLNQYTLAEDYLKVADEAKILTGRDAEYYKNIKKYQQEYRQELEKREEEAKTDDLPRVKLTLDVGEIVLELFENEAPGTVGNFVSLVDKGYYDGVGFHRVIGNFMAQGGGGARIGYSIYCECQKEDIRRHYRGTISMAHAGLNTGGPQFFLTFRPTPHLDGMHTAFGRVIEGFDVLARIKRVQPGTPKDQQSKILKAIVLRKRDHEYKPVKVQRKN